MWNEQIRIIIEYKYITSVAIVGMKNTLHQIWSHLEVTVLEKQKINKWING